MEIDRQSIRTRPPGHPSCTRPGERSSSCTGPCSKRLFSPLPDGLLDPLTWPLVAVALVILLVIRPLVGIMGFIGFDHPLALTPLYHHFRHSRHRLAVRPPYAMNEAEFTGAGQLWALVGLIILISIIGHAITAAPLTEKLNALREPS
ncbi:MAG: hypothetical protein ACLFTE_08500 [Salinivenus sp.]